MERLRKSLGLLEVLGFVCAVDVADIMAKTANIEVDDMKLTKGLGYVMVTVTGDVGAVKAAIHAGEIAARNQQAFISSKVIPRPIEGIYANLSREEKVAKKADSDKASEVSMEAAAPEKTVVTPATKEAVKKPELKKPITKQAPISETQKPTKPKVDTPKPAKPQVEKINDKTKKTGE